MALYGIETESIRAFDALLESGRTVTVTAHTHPDGDALGSVSGLVAYLRERRGKDAVAVLPDSPASTVSFIVPPSVPLLCHDTDPEACLARIAASDLVILLDANGFSRTEGLQEAFEASTAPKALIDHHVGPDTDRFRVVFSTPDVSSASELLYYVLLELPDIGGDACRLPADAARALLTGMTTDTNNFANSVYPGTFRMAAELLAAGVDREDVLAKLYSRYRENRIRAMGYLQYETLRITPEGLACIVATRDILDRFGVDEGETEGLVNIPLSIDRVKMSMRPRERLRRQAVVARRHPRPRSGRRLPRTSIPSLPEEMKKSTRILIPALLLALAAGLLPACNKEAVQLAYDKQETNIASFVEAQRKTDKTARVTYKDGVVRVTMHDTLTREGLLADTLHTGGTVSFYYAGYTLTSASVSSSNLFATNHKKTADAAGWQLSDTTAFHIRTLTLDDQLLEGLRRGLEGVRNQDECYILFSGKYGYGSKAQGTIPARSALVYHIWVNSISND